MSMKVRYTTVDGEVLAEKRAGARKCYVPDPLGSTVALLDNIQTQTDTFSYFPYGETGARTGSTPTPFQFVGTSGYYRDSASKTYVRARHLDTLKGRWFTQDPIGFAGGDFNLYRYVDNMAISATDPSGNRNYGDALCRGIHRSANWHSCSVPQWNACLSSCQGQSNVNWCCSDGPQFGGPNNGSHFNCKCLHPTPPPKPCKASWPLPGWGIGQHLNPRRPVVPVEPDPPYGFDGPNHLPFPPNPDDPEVPGEHTGMPGGIFGGGHINPPNPSDLP